MVINPAIVRCQAMHALARTTMMHFLDFSESGCIENFQATTAHGC